MTTSVPLYQPLNTLKPVADDIWIADGDVTWMNMGILRAPFSTRMTVIRLQDGGLWCHSPIAPNGALFAAIDALGKPNASTGRRIRHPEQYPQGIRQRTCGRCERPETGKMGNQQDAYQSTQAYSTGA